MSQLFCLGDLQFSLSSDNLLKSDEGNGKVFKGTFKGESVAVKKLSLNCPDISQDEQQWENLTKLQNEHLVKYHQCMVQDNFRYLVMELCQGSMLDYCKKTLDKDVALRIKATDIMWKIINAIDYLDGQKINHGDLKLENILFWKKDSKSRRVFVKLTGYGYSSENTTDRPNKINTNTSRLQLGCLFYSAATKIQEKPKDELIPPESLTEIEDDDYKVLASKLIRILINPEYSNRLQIGTLLMHPLFIQCSGDARLRLNNDEISLLWKDKQNLLLWEKYLRLINNSKILDENFDDFKDILLSETMDTPKIVNEVYETAPNFFSEYIWHIANGRNKGNNKIPSGPSIELQEELGNGSFGEVYKCEYTDEIGNLYLAACKKSKSTTEAKELFNKEMSAVRKLNHLFVVKYLDIIEKDSKRYIVMELCEGSLKDYVEGKLERIPKDSLDDKILIGQVALGLAYIHDKRIIHKDLKLENILLKHQSPRLVLAKIADFGFAKELKPGKLEFSKTWHPGTASYMAPELLNVIKGAFPASFASDVYAFGITIARIVKKGEHLFSSKENSGNGSVVNGEASNLEGLCWELQDLIPKLTDNEPGKRPEMVLVLRHPYFALTNDRTKRHFAEQLWTDFSSIVSEEERRNVIRNIFSCQKFRDWYENFSKEEPDTDEEIVNKIGNNFRLFRELKSEIKTVSLNPASPAKEYKKTVKEAITSEYDTTIGYKINQFSGPKTNRYFPATSFSKYRFYKLIERAPKILVSYFWFSLPDVPRFCKSSSLELESGISKIIPELQWSSLYYEDEELIDKLWKIKYLEHKNQKYSQETTREMIRIIGKCNVSESTWSSLLDRIEKNQLDEEKQILLLNAVHSYASNIAKVTEMIMRKYGTPEEYIFHIAAASNEGNWAAEIMQVLLEYSSNYREYGFDSVVSTSLLHAVQNESESGQKVVKLLLEKSRKTPNARYFDEQFTLVHFAASNQGDYGTEILKQLLEKGGDYAVRSTIGLWEPIHLATMNNGGSALKVFDLLLKKRGMNVIHEGSGRSLIHFATMNCGDWGPEILKKLLENGAEVNAIDNSKQTALHLVATDSVYETNQDISLMKILLENGGDPNAAEQHGRTPVHLAASSLSGEHAHEKLKLLLDQGGMSTSKDSNGLNPVHYTLLNMGICGAKMRELIGVNRESANVPLNSDSRKTVLHWIVSLKNVQLPTLSDPSKYDRKVDLVQLVLDNGGNPNAKDENGHSPVHIAVFLDGSYDGLIILQRLLQKGGDPNLIDNKEQYTPVHYAARSASEVAPEQMKILLENGGAANKSGGKHGVTPLHLAVMNSGIHGHELVEILLKYEGNPNAEDILGRSPVHYTIFNQSSFGLTLLELLLKKGGDPNLIDNENQFAPVHYAAVSASEAAPEQMKILLENGGSVNKRGGKQGLTPLQLAIVNSGIHGLKLTEILLEHGGNPNAVDNLGHSSVHTAVLKKESSLVLSILQLLLKKGGDPNLIDNKIQFTPVHYAADSASEVAPEQMKILLENGGDANKSGCKQGLTPLHLAAMNTGIHGHILTRLLLEYRGNPINIADLQKCTPLHFAILNKNDQLRLEIIKQLLEKGGNANAGDKEGLTPVHYIIRDKRSNSLEVLKLLLKHGGNILQENQGGLSPHCLATRRGNEDHCLPEVKKHIERVYRKMK